MTSLIGTIRKHWRDEPPRIHITNGIYTTKLHRNKHGQTLINYRGKNVLLLITTRSDVMISETYKRISDMVQFYTKNKLGVDILDSMRRKYSTRSATRRWSVHVHFLCPWLG
jgi:glutathione peroxidase-family protein